MPHPVLRPFIQWYLQRETAPTIGELIEPVFPRAGTMLVFQFAKIYAVKEYETEQRRRSWAATVIGPMLSRKTRLILDDQMQSLDVIFRPMGLYRLFGVPISSLTGCGTEAHAALGPQISALYERLGSAETFANRARLLDLFFLNRLKQARPLDLMSQAISRAAKGRCTVREAASMVGISERQFERRSLVVAGMSPKALAQVSRFSARLEGTSQVKVTGWRSLTKSATTIRCT